MKQIYHYSGKRWEVLEAEILHPDVCIQDVLEDETQLNVFHSHADF